MQAVEYQLPSHRYAKCVEVSKRIRWDIDNDVIRGRTLDIDQKFLPDGLSQVYRLPFLNDAERRFYSQVQGRTYANMFKLVERFIGAKMLELGRDHALGDQIALEAVVRLTDEELKHQELFRRIELLAGADMPAGYRFLPDADDIAMFVLGKSTWGILALTCFIEIFSQVHYRQSIEADDTLSPLFKDVFMYHWKEESQHAIIDELEWMREDVKLDKPARDAAVDDLIALVAGVDGVVQMQATEDATYFCQHVDRTLLHAEIAEVQAAMLDAYRWQYIVSGVEEPRFRSLLTSMIDEEQGQRIFAALAPIMKPTLDRQTLPLV
ncbi:hypothetical protein [Paraburkholderia hospita]|uniref:p-aminobenzoate N-oxygenase AurF n=1 Tax=Paraburkholderia hospita TaxID=169430 RepID=A0AAN1JDZ9_9BURK|nr:hypothetical protein [Paraburkholderia hospita]AUT71539.1 hypothetical protein C2L64_25085 [Paraburkholderia hospita]EIM99459.1 hypothetical protein WQE_18774 [Paraburkholderia hospita]OUL67743.1 hypothetical protein CA602_52285 [Paraburkholderia hospita]OUL95755.1 hypothetical protein CA601_04450 [Paraburkholderia hospita]SEI23336.1 hypothetical protein SAMN05192544_104714 [Paraburkholderia hospita]